MNDKEVQAKTKNFDQKIAVQVELFGSVEYLLSNLSLYLDIFQGYCIFQGTCIEQ